MGASVDWAIFWGYVIYLFIGWVVLCTVAYVSRKRLNRATAPVWGRAWAAWQLRKVCRRR